MSDPIRIPGAIYLGDVQPGSRFERDSDGRTIIVQPDGQIFMPAINLTSGKAGLVSVELGVDERASLGALRFTVCG